MNIRLKVKVYATYFDDDRYIIKQWKVRSSQSDPSNKYETLIRFRAVDRSVLIFENILLNNCTFFNKLVSWLPSCCEDSNCFSVTRTTSPSPKINLWLEARDTYILPFHCVIISWGLFHPLIVTKIQLEYISACLSTLGGAHSSLGEFSVKHSFKAALVSRQQYVVAKRMNDPILVQRCRLFYAHSLLQRGKLKNAVKIIRSVYSEAKACLSDAELVLTSCRAAWSKYKYLRSIKMNSSLK